MNRPSTPEFDPDKPNSEEKAISLEMLQEQYFNLKLELEESQNQFERLRGLFQTLVFGLVVAILLTIGISGWFAYRQLVQEQITRRETKRSAETNAELLEKLEELEVQLERQKQQLQTFREDVPGELETLTNTVRVNERQLKVLRDRLEQIEPAD